jgi:hypothetical protein
MMFAFADKTTFLMKRRTPQHLKDDDDKLQSMEKTTALLWSQSRFALGCRFMSADPKVGNLLFISLFLLHSGREWCENSPKDKRICNKYLCISEIPCKYTK